jgi:hypothetical protein
MAKALATFTGGTVFPFLDSLCMEDVVSRGAILTSGLNFTRGQIASYDTTTSKVKAAASAAVCNCIIAEDCDATAGDASCIIYVGGTFMASAVIWPAFAHDAITESLRDAGIQLESVEMAAGNMVKPASLSTEKTRLDDTQIIADPKSPEIITANGPVKRVSEEADAPKEFSWEPYPPPLRVQPGQTEPPKEEPEPRQSPPPAGKKSEGHPGGHTPKS